MGQANFTTCRVSLSLSCGFSPVSETSAFELRQPQTSDGQRGTALASITTALQQKIQEHKQKSKRPRPTALFSLSKADAATVGPTPERGYKVIKIAPDGRCLFRALASGLSYNQGYYTVGTEEEEKDADSLRLATFDALCRNEKRQSNFKEAVFAAKQEGEIPQYCSRLKQPTFWGGNVEMLVISKMLQVPITVMQDVSETRDDMTGYLPIAKYGEEFLEKRKPVTVLYSSGNHYDLLCK